MRLHYLNVHIKHTALHNYWQEIKFSPAFTILSFFVLLYPYLIQCFTSHVTILHCHTNGESSVWSGSSVTSNSEICTAVIPIFYEKLSVQKRGEFYWHDVYTVYQFLYNHLVPITLMSVINIRLVKDRWILYTST
jgi:hypothetical protein